MPTTRWGVLDLFGSPQTKELCARSSIDLEPLTHELALLCSGLVPLSSIQLQARPPDLGQEKRRLFAALARSGREAARPSDGAADCFHRM